MKHNVEVFKVMRRRGMGRSGKVKSLGDTDEHLEKKKKRISNKRTAENKNNELNHEVQNKSRRL